MGFCYRKSVSDGPFRVNIGKCVLGDLVGSRDFRKRVSTTGRRYTTFNIPVARLGTRTGLTSQGWLVVALGIHSLTWLWLKGRP